MDRAVWKDPSWRIVETRRRPAPCAIMDCPVQLDGLQGRKFTEPGAANPQETDTPVRPIPSFHADSCYVVSAETQVADAVTSFIVLFLKLSRVIVSWYPPRRSD